MKTDDPQVGPISERLPAGIARDFADGTASSEEEVHRLLGQLRAPAPAPRSLAAPALVLALVALVLMALKPPASIQEVEVVRTVEVARAEEPLLDGIFASVVGELQIVEDGPTAVLQLVDGAVGLRTRRALVLAAGDLTLSTREASVQVAMVDQRVSVRVLEGSVSLSHADNAAIALVAGQRWASPALPLAPTPAPIAVPRERLPEPVAVVEPPAPAASPRDAASQLADLLDLISGEAPSEALLASLAVLEQDWPSTAECQEAIVRVAEVRATRLPAGEAVRMLAEVRDSHPGLPRRLDLLELQASITKDGLRDCSMALPVYRELAAAAKGVQRAEAQAWRGICAQHLELTPEALTALRSAAAGPLPPQLRAVVEQTIERIELLQE